MIKKTIPIYESVKNFLFGIKFIYIFKNLLEKLKSKKNFDCQVEEIL